MKRIIIIIIASLVLSCAPSKPSYNFVYNHKKGLLVDRNTNKNYSEMPGPYSFDRFIPPIGTDVEKVNNVYGKPNIPGKVKNIKRYYYILIPKRVTLSIGYKEGKVESRMLSQAELIFHSFPPVSIHLTDEKEQIYGEDYNELSKEKKEEIFNHDWNVNKRNWIDLNKKYGNVIWEEAGRKDRREISKQLLECDDLKDFFVNRTLNDAKILRDIFYTSNNIELKKRALVCWTKLIPIWDATGSLVKEKIKWEEENIKEIIDVSIKIMEKEPSESSVYSGVFVIVYRLIPHLDKENMQKVFPYLWKYYWKHHKYHQAHALKNNWKGQHPWYYFEKRYLKRYKNKSELTEIMKSYLKDEIDKEVIKDIEDYIKYFENNKDN